LQETMQCFRLDRDISWIDPSKVGAFVFLNWEFKGINVAWKFCHTNLLATICPHILFPRLHSTSLSSYMNFNKVSCQLVLTFMCFCVNILRHIQWFCLVMMISSMLSLYLLSTSVRK
jgi:hypothetical protein